jgi:hypothetical protein
MVIDVTDTAQVVGLIAEYGSRFCAKLLLSGYWKKSRRRSPAGLNIRTHFRAALLVALALYGSMNSVIPVDFGQFGLLRPDVLLVRLSEGEHLSLELVQRVMQLRRDHFGTSPMHLVLQLPSYLDFDVQLMHTDHRGVFGKEDEVLSLTWVAGSEMNKSLIEVYYAYFPSRLPMRILVEDHELRARLSELSALTSSW